MAVEDLRLQARQELEGIGVSPESASFLVHDRPPGGWESLVTSDQLRAEISALTAELRKEMQSQTRWLTGVLLVGMSLVAGILRVG